MEKGTLHNVINKMKFTQLLSKKVKKKKIYTEMIDGLEEKSKFITSARTCDVSDV